MKKEVQPVGSTWGNNLKISVFGESHGAAVGVVIDGLPSGITLDEGAIAKEMARRSASGKNLATPRKEADAVEIISGTFNGCTTGTPLTGIITNTNTKSKDYNRNVLRPGHADYTAFRRYQGFQDHRGGGHFSGRLTAPMVFAGAVCKQVLAQWKPGVGIGSRIVAIGGVSDAVELPVAAYGQMTFSHPELPIYDSRLEAAMRNEILDAMAEEDSVGGIIEGFVTGLPAGVGDPIFDTMESRLASILFGVPAVKGLEFGTGFAMAAARASEMNDAFYLEDGEVVTHTNHNGGINGGITNGMPLVFRVAFKPTPSIAATQHTVDIAAGEEVMHSTSGRHDPCIVVRACPVVEAVTALCILDSLMGAEKWMPFEAK